MPAIQIAKLRQNSAQLMLLFKQPESFVKGLHSLLNRYAERTHRPGQSGEPAPLLDLYNVPKPVIRQILTDIKPLVLENSTAALELCDSLWNETYFEFRYLAAAILGQITPDPPEPVLVRIKNWSEQITEIQLIEVLFERGLDRVKLENPDYLIDQIDHWLDDPNPAVKKLGLQALIPVIRSADSENLPVLFRFITPTARELPSALRTDVRDVVQELAIRSPVETAYFLRQLISTSGSANAAWLARQNLRYFPDDVQASLRVLLRIPLPEK